MPVTYKGVGRDNLFTMTCTVIFKNALFKTDIRVAPYELDAFDPEFERNRTFHDWSNEANERRFVDRGS